MKKRISLVCIALTCIFTGSFAQLTKINWQPTLLEIDGNPNDWTTNLRFFDSESKIKYEFRNDASTLYFVFKSDEKSVHQQLQQAELKMKFVVKANEKTTATIHIAAKKGNRGMPMLSMNGGQHPPMPLQTQNEEFNSGQFPPPGQFPMFQNIQTKDTASIKGFLFTKNQIFSNNSDVNTIRFAKSSPNMEETALEVAIPLRELFGEIYNLEDIGKTPVMFQLTINGVSQSNKSSEMHGSPGGMGGRPGGAPGGMGNGPEGMGGGPGGMGGGEMGQRPEMPEGMNQNSEPMTKKSLKFSFVLNTVDSK